jgi:KamA family protein
MRRNRTIRKIHEVFGMPAKAKNELAKVEQVFPFKATEYYLSLIDWEDPNDPIRRIVIPEHNELELGGDLDPSDEKANSAAPGVQHKYPHTALLLASNNCAGLCRYCFRKRLFLKSGTGRQQAEVANDPQPALEYIAKHREITNVLLTGGDPLTLPNDKLRYLLEELREISHVGVIRIGTRTPVFNPQRITEDEELIRILKRVNTSERRVNIVTHFDHPRELTEESLSAVALLINNGLPVLNQHPILAGVNDDPDVLTRLYRELTSAGVANYYLFLVRPTAGNESFQVPITRAYEIYQQALSRLCGIGKRIRLVMSHATGKIQILRVDDDYIYTQYHRARNRDDEARMVIYRRDDNACWLDELQEVELVPRWFD